MSIRLSAFHPLRPTLAAATLLLLAATGCEKVVDLNLNTSASQLVIEADLANDGQPVMAHLTRSVNYDDPNNFPPLTGATLVLSDDAGHLETLTETAPGQYQGSTLLGVAGRTYTLRVEADGNAYVATSQLPAPVTFERLSTEEPIFVNKDKPDERQAVVQYSDPVGQGNYYRFRQFRNGRLNNTIFVRDDEFSDGNQVTQTLRSRVDDPNDLEVLLVGDSLTVEMQTIDKGVYDYFRTLNQIANGSAANSAAPTNPLSNFSGNVLGYFSAHSRQMRREVVR